MKTCLAIHDLSCHASSSLGVVLPILSVGGVDASFLPSAVLSTQSDGFDNLYSRDLTSDCREIMARWRLYGFAFDSLYSGYLATHGQLEMVMEARLTLLKDDALILTDPVMGDGGGLYQSLTDEHVGMMRSLCAGSAVVTPNHTEACLLLGEEMKEELSSDEAGRLARDIHLLTGAKAVVTSVPLKGGVWVNAASDGNEERLFSFELVGDGYPGCGDMFASVLLSLLLGGRGFFDAARTAGEVSSLALLKTWRERRPRREGVVVRHALEALLRD